MTPRKTTPRKIRSSHRLLQIAAAALVCACCLAAAAAQTRDTAADADAAISLAGQFIESIAAILPPDRPIEQP